MFIFNKLLNNLKYLVRYINKVQLGIKNIQMKKTPIQTRFHKKNIQMLLLTLDKLQL